MAYWKKPTGKQFVAIPLGDAWCELVDRYCQMLKSDTNRRMAPKALLGPWGWLADPPVFH